jgi:hypothetical protein
MERHKIWAGVLIVAMAASVSIGATSHSAAAFKKLQSLAGDWTGKDEHGMDARTNFKIIVANTTVMETLAVSGMEEMITIYHVDGDAITLVHYCPTNNQPRMRAVPETENIQELKFSFEGAGNLPSLSVGHQHQLTIRFEDDNHITETWIWREKGKDTPMVFHLTRKTS